MDNGHYLRFLRPYLYQMPSPRASVYARFFSVSYRDPVRCKGSHGPGQVHSASRSRCVHSSAPERPATATANSDSPAPDAVSPTPRRLTVNSRVQKLKEYNALRYPRLGPRPNRMSVPSFRERYQDVTNASEEVVLEGRVMSVRRAGSKLVFLNLMGGYQQVQVMICLSHFSDPKPEPEQFKDAVRPLLRGDIISVKGTATRTHAGELTLKAHELPTLLSPGLAPLPHKLINQETMVLNKHLDLLANRRTSDIFRLRSSIIKSMRDFFHEKDFLEVQTPVLADYAGGAAARPFLTFATEFAQKELAMRIAPELWLKRLIVGGNDKVFEIGQCFRNEGIDTTHNPEFTMCEFYSAYSNLDDLISMTEDLITRLVNHVEHLAQNQLKFLENSKIQLPEKKWKQIEFIPTLEDILRIKIPNLSEADALPKLIEILGDRIDFAQGSSLTLVELLDELAGKYLEPLSRDEPVFITYHPACMAPLSKSFVCPKTGQLVSARAELFIKDREMANMYEEENDPFEQQRKFELQLETQKAMSPESEDHGEVDKSYVQALQHGLPPTGGWGCGVDRLVMLLSGAPRIGDVLSFGTLRNVVSIRQAAKD